jgi:hypothetical protein
VSPAGGEQTEQQAQQQQQQQQQQPQTAANHGPSAAPAPGEQGAAYAQLLPGLEKLQRVVFGAPSGTGAAGIKEQLAAGLTQ